MGEIRQRYFRALMRIKNPAFDSVNPHFNNKFASLPATLDVIKAACEPEGLAYWQRVKLLDFGVVLQTGIISEDGEEMEQSIVPLTNNPDSQKFGAELTYKKRQLGQVDWCICGEVDDDGESAPHEHDYSLIAPLKRRYMQARHLSETEASQELVQALGNPAKLDDRGYQQYLRRLEALVREEEKN